MSSISGLGSSILDVVPQTTKTQSSTEDNPASLNDEALYNLVTNVSKFTQSSNAIYVLNKVNQSIYSGNAADVQSAIGTYTQGLPNSAVYDSPYTAPSAQFLKDLAAIKNDASSGNLAAAAADFQTAKSASPENTTGGISAAYEKHDTSAIAAIALEGTVNTSKGTRWTPAVSIGPSVALHSNPGIALVCFQVSPGFQYMAFLHRIPECCTQRPDEVQAEVRTALYGTFPGFEYSATAARTSLVAAAKLSMTPNR